MGGIKGGYLLAAAVILLLAATGIAAATPPERRIFWPFLLVLLPLAIFVLSRCRPH